MKREHKIILFSAVILVLLVLMIVGIVLIPARPTEPPAPEPIPEPTPIEIAPPPARFPGVPKLPWPVPPPEPGVGVGGGIGSGAPKPETHYGKNIDGGKVIGMAVPADELGCMQQCQSNPKCTQWAFAPYNLFGGIPTSKTCFLRDQPGTPIDDINAIYGTIPR